MAEPETQPGPPKVSRMAVVAMSLGVASIAFSLLTAVPAIILALVSLGKINRNPMKLGGKGFAIAGLVCAIALPLAAGLVAMTMWKNYQAQQRARGVHCLTNVRKLNIAMLMYSNEYDGFFPPSGVMFPSPNWNRYPADLVKDPQPDLQKYTPQFGSLWDYMNRRASDYKCISDDGVRSSPDAIVVSASGVVSRGGGSGRGVFSYSVNATMIPTSEIHRCFSPYGAGSALTQLPYHPPLRMQNISRPYEYVVFAEEDPKSSFNDDAFCPPAYAAMSPIKESGIRSYLADRHMGRGSLGFGDGHAEQLDAAPFNAIPSPAVTHLDLMSSSTTRSFFPDGGEFSVP